VEEGAVESRGWRGWRDMERRRGVCRGGVTDVARRRRGAGGSSGEGGGRGGGGMQHTVGWS
jgi:hypothetical protein